MIAWHGISPDTMDWLLEPEHPAVRYLAMRDLLHVPADHPDLVAARLSAHHQGPIAEILARMQEPGYWSEPGPGYYPKYRGTVWSVIALAQLGASVEEDPRLAAACTYLLDHALTRHGQFSMNGAPSATVDCLQGNLCWALVTLGCEDPRLTAANEWMARSVTGEGVAPQREQQAEIRYYAGKCGPLFACGANNKLSCAWGGAKVLLAFSMLPESRRTPLIRRAIAQGAEFFLSADLARAQYPNGYSDQPSRNWWKFGFPVFYVTDILQVVEGLAGLGYQGDPRLMPALDIIAGKQDEKGRWSLEYDYAGKTWVDLGAKRMPNKWVTLRAAKVLKDCAGDPAAAGKD